MVMMMMASNVSFMGHKFHGGRNVLMMVVMSVGLEPLDPTTQRRAPAVALLITLGIIIFGLSSLVSGRVVAAWFGVAADFLRCMVQVFTSAHAIVREGQLSTRDLGTRDSQAADPTSNTRKHSAEFALDAGFSGRSLYLRLGTLDCLRQWRYTSLSVHLLDSEKVLLRHRMGAIFHGPRPRRLKDSRMAAAVGNRRRRRAILTGPVL